MNTNSDFGYHGTGIPEDILSWGICAFHPAIALACSFSPEDIVLLHMMIKLRPDVRVFAIDTGRLNDETYECADAVLISLGVKIQWYFPERDDVEELEREKGLFSFRASLEARHECCRIRKVEPLNRALAGLKAWITGLRREQSETRKEMGQIEHDEMHGGIVKINPLVDWNVSKVWQYIRQHRLPYNRLHNQGYTSIGCAPCTRSTKPWEHPRSGRWWWENPEEKECGLHIRR